MTVLSSLEFREPAMTAYVSLEFVRERNRKWLPSGRNTGNVCATSCRFESKVVMDSGRPPAAETRFKTPSVKMMMPSRFQLPPNPPATSQITCAGPPLRSTFLSLPDVKKAMNRSSGAQNGKAARAPSVPDNNLGSRESRERTQIREIPSCIATNATFLPLCETTGNGAIAAVP